MNHTSVLAGVFAGCFAVLTGWCAAASIADAGPIDCEFIKDHDKRQYCRALASGSSSYCEFIKDHDLRHECRARVKH